MKRSNNSRGIFIRSVCCGDVEKWIAQFISICRWLQLVYKDQLALLENAPFSTL